MWLLLTREKMKLITILWLSIGIFSKLELIQGLESAEETNRNVSAAGNKPRQFKMECFRSGPCNNSSNSLVNIAKLGFNYPVILPGKVTINFEIEIFRDIHSPLKLKHRLYKYKMSRWNQLPCPLTSVQCDFEDFCETLKEYSENEKDVCPLEKGSYRRQNITLSSRFDELMEMSTESIVGTYKLEQIIHEDKECYRYNFCIREIH